MGMAIDYNNWGEIVRSKFSLEFSTILFYFWTDWRKMWTAFEYLKFSIFLWNFTIGTEMQMAGDCVYNCDEIVRSKFLSQFLKILFKILEYGKKCWRRSYSAVKEGERINFLYFLRLHEFRFWHFDVESCKLWLHFTFFYLFFFKRRIFTATLAVIYKRN